MTIRQPIITVAGHVDHGKCVSGDTIIPLVDGTLITAKELFEKNLDKNKAKKINGDIVQEVNNLIFFSMFNSYINNKKVSHIWKRKSKNLIEIKTAHGDILKTTPEHPYFKYSINGPLKIKSEDLIEGDYIAVPKIIKIKDSDPEKIIFQSLKESDFLCFLNSNSKELIQKVRKIGIKKLANKLSIRHLDDSLRKNRIRIKDLINLTKSLKITDKETYSMIDGIKNSSTLQRGGHTSKIIKLPDLHDPEKFGYILGCIAGDGHLSKTQVLLDNNDKEIQEKYSEYLKNIFNIESFIKQNHTCETVINKAGLTFKKFIKEIIGIPDKKKSANIAVPRVAQVNKNIFKGFFSGLIDTDGYVSHLNYSIELTSKSKNLIKQCSILLLNFEIQSVIYEKNSFYVLRIANRTNIEKFLENFNLRLKRKLERVISASRKTQSSRIFDIYPIQKEELKSLILPGKINKKVPYYNKYLKSQDFTTSFLNNVLKNIKEENTISLKIKSILSSEINYVKVISKKEIKNKEKYVYDFTVPESHNFVAERTIVHNTSILDRFRGTSVQASEAGGITQKISFTKYPKEQIYKTSPLIKQNKIELKIPGFLFIDTPGHAAFTNLRKRGGSLADLAILVVDIREGIKPQTAEVLSILKSNKTPFVIALNKIDTISGWQKRSSVKESIELLPIHIKEQFDTLLLTFQAAMQSHGFNPELYYEISDFTKNVAIVPCSAKTGEGISELLFVLSGLSQKFLTKQLELSENAKGVLLEIKREKIGMQTEAILYDGQLKENDEIVIAAFSGNPIITKIRSIEEIQPLTNKFKTTKIATAATGIKLHLTHKEGLLSGMPFEKLDKTKNNLEEISEKFKKEISKSIDLDKEGIIIKADSLGSLEALITLLKQSNIKIVSAGIGPINKKDIISAKANLEINPSDAVIVGFNVDIEESIDLQNIKVIKNEVVYKLIEDLDLWRKEKQAEVERERLLGLATICKLEILPQYLFRNSNPAIFGVRILAGNLKKNIQLIDQEDNTIARVKAIQHERNSVGEATENQEVAISLPGTNFERQFQNKNIKCLYSQLSESQFKNFKNNKDLLSQNEIKALSEIAEIKRKKNSDWGI